MRYRSYDQTHVKTVSRLAKLSYTARQQGDNAVTSDAPPLPSPVDMLTISLPKGNFKPSIITLSYVSSMSSLMGY